MMKRDSMQEEERKVNDAMIEIKELTKLYQKQINIKGEVEKDIELVGKIRGKESLKEKGEQLCENTVC